MKLQKVLGATSEIWQIFIQDSSSAIGAGLTGLTNASGNLTAYYHRDTDTTATAIALVSMTAGTFTSSGFVVVDGTNMPGVYQFCPPNAALASGAKSVVIMLKGATNMAPVLIEVQLVAVNPDSAAAFVTGVNSLAPPTNWNLDAIDASGRRDVGKWLGTAVSTPTVAGVPNVNAKTWNDLTTVALPLIPATPGRSLVVDAAGLADANVVKLGPTGAGTAQTARDVGLNVDATISSRTKPADTQARVTLVDTLTTYTGNTPQTGDAYARVGAAGAGLSAIPVVAHVTLVDTVTTLTNAPSDSSGVTTLLARLTALRAGYLDNLSAGAVALEASLQGLITTVGASAAGIASAVWSAATRVLTAGTNIVLAKGVGLTGLNDIAASAVISDATPFAGASIAAIKAKTDNLTSTPADETLIISATTAIMTRLGTPSVSVSADIAALPTAVQNADALIGRNIAGGSSAGRIVKDVLRFNRNKVEIVVIDATTGTLNVYAEDDTTIAWTAVVTRAAADALAAMDPA